MCLGVVSSHFSVNSSQRFVESFSDSKRAVSFDSGNSELDAGMFSELAPAIRSGG